MDNHKNRSPRPVFGKPQLVGIAIMSVVMFGLLVDVSNATNQNDNFLENITRLEKAAMLIHQKYVEDIRSDTLIDYGINGMLRVLDPHTTYFNEDQYNDLMMHTEGKFGGLGIQIAIRNKVLTVMTPISGTPASRAGIQSGDQIIAIDGKSTAGISIENAVSKLRGEPKSKVTITIRRKGEAKDIDYAITREIITIKPVPYYGVLDSGIGYINLTTFSEDASQEVGKAVRELMKRHIRGLVLDLRFDPGGLLPQAKEVAEKFLPKGSLIVSTRGRVAEQNNDLRSEKEPALPADIPVAVLVNYASASASEIVTGAIQDWDRGIVVGDTTFGKGSVQTVLPLDSKYHLKLTEAFYYTPSGRCINRPENGVRGTYTEDGDSDAGDNGAAPAPEKPKRDTSRFLTKNGRVVYGGGGIIPDTVVHQEIPSVVVRSLFAKDVFFQFSNNEYAKLKARNQIGQGPIVVTDQIVSDFYRFLDSTKFAYTSIAQTKFDDFKKRSSLMKDSADSGKSKTIVIPGEKPEWTDRELSQLKSVSAQIDTLLAHESKREIAGNEKDIRKYLYEAFLIRHYGQDDEAYWRWKLSDDQQLKTAISLIANKAAYTQLLKPRLQQTGAR